MTITINLAPDTEAQLRETAAREGRDAEAIAASLLAETLAWKSRERAETVAALQESFDAIAAGREKPLEQYIAQQRVQRGKPDAWPSSEGVTETAPGVFVSSAK